MRAHHAHGANAIQGRGREFREAQPGRIGLRGRIEGNQPLGGQGAKDVEASGRIEREGARDFRDACRAAEGAQSPFENAYGWAMRLTRSAPMATWIMASETSRSRS